MSAASHQLHPQRAALVRDSRPHGNLKVYDVGRTVRIDRMSADFERLSVDPYVKEGFRYGLWDRDRAAPIRQAHTVS